MIISRTTSLWDYRACQLLQSYVWFKWVYRVFIGLNEAVVPFIMCLTIKVEVEDEISIPQCDVGGAMTSCHYDVPGWQGCIPHQLYHRWSALSPLPIKAIHTADMCFFCLIALSHGRLVLGHSYACVHARLHPILDPTIVSETCDL